MSGTLVRNSARRHSPLPELACAGLAQSISRNPTDEVMVSATGQAISPGRHGRGRPRGCYVTRRVQSCSWEPLLTAGDETSARIVSTT